MKKRFIVALNASSPEQQKAFRKYLESSGLGWWHWLDKLWLISNPKVDLTASNVRDSLNNFFPGVNCMVFELRGNDDTWSGFGPSSEKNNMFDWIKRNW